MSTRVAVAEPDVQSIIDTLAGPVETAAIGRGRLTRHGDDLTVIVTDVELVDDDNYLERSAKHLTLRPDGWSPRCRHIVRGGDIPVFLHSHPNGPGVFSSLDDDLDRTVGGELRRTADNTIFVSVVVAGTPSAPHMAARLVEDDHFRDVDAVRVVGDHVDLHVRDESLILRSDVHDRAIRALGSRGRRVLSSLRVGFAGLGGTGSPSLEQATRVGVGSVVIVDNDIVTESTVSRGYGTTIHDLNRPKVDVAADHVRRMGLDTKVLALNLDIRDHAARLALAQCDIVFGCTDSHASRIVLSRLAYLHLVPVIDVGVVVAHNAGRLDGWGRVTWVGPGAACLLCGGHVDPQIAAVESLDPDERRQLATEGYVPDLDEPAPSVIAYTTMVAAEAVAELLDRCLHLHERDEASETLLQLNARRKRRSRPRPRNGCHL